MRKIIIPLTFISLIFSSCKTSPVEKNNTKITSSARSLTVSETSSDSEKIKFYFPSFMTYDEKSKKEKMVSGDGIIIILPDGKVMMVDSFEVEAREDLVNFLKSLGIKRIDYFFASHNHSDHIGGVPALFENFEIENYYWNGANFSTKIDKEVSDLFINSKTKVQVIHQGDSLILCDNPLCKIDVLWPNLTEEIIHDAYYNPGKTQKLKNNTSLVFKLIYKDFTALFTGDVYKDGDKAITRMYKDNLHVTLLKVPHHGEFYTANSPAFVKAISPEIAVIQDNRYINFVISSIYRRVKAKLLYRNSGGYILVQSNGTEYSVEQYSF